MIIKDLDAVFRSNSTAFKNLYKDPLSGHDTISHLFVYGTAVMAFLADLGDFHQCVFSQLQAGAHRQFPEFDAFGGNVFGKIAWIDIKTLLSNFGNAFNGQKTDLAMPITGMGVVFQAVVFNKAAQKYVCFFDAFFETYRYGNNPTIGGLFMMCHFFLLQFKVQISIRFLCQMGSVDNYTPHNPGKGHRGPETPVPFYQYALLTGSAAKPGLKR